MRCCASTDLVNHGPDLERRGGGVPRRGAGVARPATSPSGAPSSAATRVGRHPRGLRPAPRAGSGGCSPTAGRWCRGRPSTAAAGRRCGSGCSSRRSTTGPAARQRVTQNGIFLLAPSIYEFGTAAQQRRDPAPHGRGRGPVVPGLVGAQRRQRPRLRVEPGPAGRRRLGARRPEDLDDRAARSARTSSACSAPTPRASATRASPTCSCRSTRPASPCAASGASTATRASPRCSSTTRSSPTTPSPAAWCWASPRAAGASPWPPPGPSAGSRCARRGASSPPPSGWSSWPPTRGDAVVRRRRLADAWMHAEAYQLQTLPTVTRLAAGAKPGAEASLTKLWWSELDVELHQVALDLLGPEAELEGPWSKGWQFSLSGPIYAGTNEIQRNIAAERLLACPPMRFASTDDQLAVPGRGAATCWPRSARQRWCGPRGTRRPASSTAACGQPRRHGRARRPGARGRRRPRASTSRYLVPVLEAAGRPRCPTRSWRRRWWPPRCSAPAAGLVTSDLGGPVVPCAADADACSCASGDAARARGRRIAADAHRRRDRRPRPPRRRAVDGSGAARSSPTTPPRSRWPSTAARSAPRRC